MWPLVQMVVLGFYVTYLELEIVERTKKWFYGKKQIEEEKTLHAMNKLKKVTDRVCIITGANSGVGYETAYHLAGLGYHIIFACRSKQLALEAIDRIKKKHTSAQLEFIQLDLSDQENIRHFVDVIQQRGLQIDCLINNAGVMWLDKCYTKEKIEMHFGVNYLGHYLLTILLLPHMKKHSRILMLGSITSLFGKIPFDDINLNKGYNKFEAYANSKLAICHFAQSLAKRLEKSGKNISVFYVNPGSVTTEITKTLPYILQFLYKTVGKIIFKTPFQGACCSIYAAISDELDGKNGLFLYECRVQESISRSLPIYNSEREMLWQLSEKLTSSQYPF